MAFEVPALQVNYPEPDRSSEPEKKREPVVINSQTVAAAVLAIIAGWLISTGMVPS